MSAAALIDITDRAKNAGSGCGATISGVFCMILSPLRIPTAAHYTLVILYYFHPCRLAKASIARQNLSHRANVICDGSPSRIRMVLRISLGMTTRPRSSIRRTMPVAFIYEIPPVKADFTWVVSSCAAANMHPAPTGIKWKPKAPPLRTHQNLLSCKYRREG